MIQKVVLFAPQTHKKGVKCALKGSRLISAPARRLQKMRDFRNSVWLIARGSVTFEEPVSHSATCKCR